MIRKDREVTDVTEIEAIISKCDVCRVALNGDDGFPYIVPLNFGYKREGDSFTLYFHSALIGKKHDLMRRDNRATFEMDCDHDMFSVEERGYCTMNYKSVIGHGVIEYIDDADEKIEALTLLTDRYHGGSHFDFNHAALPRTSVYRLVVADITGKRKSSGKH